MLTVTSECDPPFRSHSDSHCDCYVQTATRLPLEIRFWPIYARTVTLTFFVSNLKLFCNSVCLSLFSRPSFPIWLYHSHNQTELLWLRVRLGDNWPSQWHVHGCDWISHSYWFILAHVLFRFREAIAVSQPLRKSCFTQSHFLTHIGSIANSGWPGQPLVTLIKLKLFFSCRLKPCLSMANETSQWVTISKSSPVWHLHSPWRDPLICSEDAGIGGRTSGSNRFLRRSPWKWSVRLEWITANSELDSYYWPISESYCSRSSQPLSVCPAEAGQTRLV